MKQMLLGIFGSSYKEGKYSDDDFTSEDDTKEDASKIDTTKGIKSHDNADIEKGVNNNIVTIAETSYSAITSVQPRRPFSASGIISPLVLNEEEDPNESSSIYIDSEDEVSYYSSDEESSSEEDLPYELAEIDLKSVFLTKTVGDGITQISYVDKGTMYLASNGSSFSIFLTLHREKLKRLSNNKSVGTITYVKTKATPKGIMLASVYHERRKDLELESRYMKEFAKRTSYWEVIPEKGLQRDPGSVEYVSKDGQRFIYSLDKKSLHRFERECAKTKEGDIATTRLSDEEGGSTYNISFDNHIQRNMSLLEPTEVSSKEEEEEEEEEDIIDGNPFVVKEEMITSETKDPIKDRRQELLTNLLGGEKQYVLASEREFIVYEHLMVLKLSLFPFFEVTRNFCKEARVRCIYGRDSINSYRRYLENQLSPNEYFPKLDRALIQESRNVVWGPYDVPDYSVSHFRTGEGEGEEEETKKGKTLKDKKIVPPDVISIATDIAHLSDRLREESVCVDSQWSNILHKNLKEDNTPLTFLTMEAMCSEWCKHSEDCIQIIEAYRFLFAVSSDIEGFVNATNSPDSRQKYSGVFIESQMFRTFCNALANIRKWETMYIRNAFTDKTENI